MKYIARDTNRAEATVIYWFENETSTYGISDHNGERTALDCDGATIDYNDQLRDQVLNECVVTNEMINEYRCK